MNIIFEDESIYIVNKPAGVPVQTKDNTEDSIFSYLPADALHLVHRIDQVASGLIMIAKTPSAADQFSKLFKHKKIRKTYIAIVTKGVAEKEATIAEKLVRNGKLRKAFVNEKGKQATLSYLKIGETDKYDCLKVVIKQGRFHMIRCMLSHYKMPIKGDVKYGARRKNPDRSIDLHAYGLRFTHPVTKEIHNIVAPLRADNLWTHCAQFIK